MKLPGHSAPEITMAYIEITQPDLRREYELARSHPRHLVPPPRVPLSLTAAHANLATLLDFLRAIQHVLEMLRRAVPDDATRRLLARMGNRLIKMVTQLCQLNHSCPN